MPRDKAFFAEDSVISLGSLLRPDRKRGHTRGLWFMELSQSMFVSIDLLLKTKYIQGERESQVIDPHLSLLSFVIRQRNKPHGAEFELNLI
jgi:hypothetical protein